MASGRLDSQRLRKACSGVASVALHGMVLLIILSGGRQDGIDSGDVPTSKLVLLEAREADSRDGVELPPVEPVVVPAPSEEELHAALEQLDEPAVAAIGSEAVEIEVGGGSLPEQPGPSVVRLPEIAATIAVSHSEKAALSERLERLAVETLKAPRAEVAWEEDGKQYSAVLIRERANDGTALERVIAEVSASDRGRHLTTIVNLKRLAFSQFTQMVDYWDPNVQLHDDEIVGRFHSNSRFNVMYDRRTAPKFLGKVTTAARSFNTDSRGRRRDSEIFRGGIETRASEIHLPESLQPFEWAPREANARIHELAADTRIRFFADGSYTWRSGESSQTQYVNEPSDHPVYFLAAPGKSLFVAGVVAGKILVYSPQRIVIEGDLTYARDPREIPESRDYLGLVSDRYVEVASPQVTGPGDLEIDAAIFAGRRFAVRDFEHPRAATLRIYGSLASGTLTATEPRYASKIEYDNRFEHQRPPGFPSTNRYEVADWDGQWTEAQRHAADE